MKHTTTTILAAAAVVTAVNSQTTSPDAWERINDWSVNDVLYGSLYLQGVGGFSSNDPADLALGEHDPKRESFSAQAIEPTLALRTPYFEAFSNYLWTQDENGDWDGELEELFGKVLIPGGFSIKGGQFLSRFGLMSSRHSHSWDFVDAEMTVSRFLGEDGLMLRGVEATWELPFQFTPGLTNVASIGYGKARSHDHGHEEGHGDHGALFEADEAYLSEHIFTARWMSRYAFSDFHSISGGLSYAGGDNAFDRSTHIYGLDFGYQWRENGLEPGGRAFRVSNELAWRRVAAFEEADAPDEADERGRYTEFGFYTTGTYTWNKHLDTSLRVSWLEGVEELDLEKRLRISPAVTWWFDDNRRVGLRTQYNYDRLEGQSEHTAWFQLNVALGSRVEVR
jgi:hypothetical protein